MNTVLAEGGLNERADVRCGGLSVVVLTLVSVMFLPAEHQFNNASLRAAMEATQAEQASVDVEDGNAVRRVAFLALGTLGLLLFLGSEKHRLNWDNPLAWLAIALAGACFLSVLWSVEPALSRRRVAVLVLLTCAAMGIVSRMKDEELLTLVLIWGTLNIAIGVVVELKAGWFRPWAPGYRFSGTLHPNSQGGYCALMFLAAVSLAAGRRHKRLWIALAAVAAVFLLLAKSRSSIAALAVSLVTLAMLRSSWKWRVLGPLAFGWGVAVILLFIFLLPIGVLQSAQDILLMGRTEDYGTFAGRVPLWQALGDYLGNRPWGGYGWGAFWTPGRISDVSADQRWSITSAHSTYVEMALQTGWLGLALLLATAGAALWRAAELVRRAGTPAVNFVFALLVYATVHGLTESSFAWPSLAAFLVTCAVLQLSLRTECLLAAETPFAAESTPSRLGLESPHGAVGK